MDFSAYERRVIDDFKGLYGRGSGNECPPDHLLVANNVVFTKRGEVSTRPGTTISLNLTHPVRRQFLATFDNARLILLTLDDSGNIYQDANSSPILSISGMTDFAGLNMYNRCYILPIGVVSHLKMWDGTGLVRDAGGAAPPYGGLTFTAAETGTAGLIDPGYHQFAFSYIFNSGFTTHPGPMNGANFVPVGYTASGGKQGVLSGISAGPLGVTGRQIYATKSNLETYFYLTTINDNSTTTLTINFRDTDLTVSADSMFDVKEFVPSGYVFGYLDKYHGRMIVIGGEGDLIRVSDSGAPESFNAVTGYIQLPSESDGNVATGSVQLRDVLYFTKSAGIFLATDTGGEPSSWPVIRADGAAGASSHGIASITASQNNLDFNDQVLIADFSGIYNFNGTVQQPPLTYKIDNIWKTNVTPGVIGGVTLFVDPFQRLVFAHIVSTNNILLVGDYNEGLTAEGIRWAIWTFPNQVKNISVMTYHDLNSYGYYLRMSYIGKLGLFRIDPTVNADDISANIASTMRTYLADFDAGSVNIFRGTRISAVPLVNATSINLFVTAYLANGTSSFQYPVIQVAPGSSVDYFRETNVVGESCAFEFSMSSKINGFKISRVDIFGKAFWAARPA